MKKNPLDRLIELAAPPDQKLYSNGDWDWVQQMLGTELPTEYKKFINVFGQGFFEGYKQLSGLFISSYFSPESPVKVAEATAGQFRMFEHLPFNVYPERPGLLGFGSYKDVDILAWHTLGAADDWSIVYLDVETGCHEIKGVGFIELITSILEQRSPLHPNLIRMGSMEGPHIFKPGS